MFCVLSSQAMCLFPFYKLAVFLLALQDCSILCVKGWDEFSFKTRVDPAAADPAWGGFDTEDQKHCSETNQGFPENKMLP